MAFVPTIPISRANSSSASRSAFLPRQSLPCPSRQDRCRILQALVDLDRQGGIRKNAPRIDQVQLSPSKPKRKDSCAVPTPGESDVRYFSEGASVAFWRDHEILNRSNFSGRALRFLSSARGVLSAGPSSTAYWSHGLLRFIFFSGLFTAGAVGGAMAGYVTPQKLRDTLVARGLLGFEAAAHVFAQDEARVKAGIYRKPWDAELWHRQSNPMRVASESGRVIREALSIIRKKESGSKDVDVWMDGSMYPDYYKQSYHFQSDGWFSSNSAEAYEMASEVVFMGLQDAMQRLTLIPLSEFLGRPGGKMRWSGRTPRVLEIGAGTGRFATFVRDNWPELDYTVSELSPFYLQKARENMEYWERTAGIRRKLGKVTYVQANAEDLPLEDSSVDIVYSIYLFHELPPSARRAVVAEAARVLRPGGRFVITDSLQHGDRLEMDDIYKDHERFNEPWYGTYLREDLGAMVEGDGWFTGSTKELSLFTKMLSFVRTQLQHPVKQ